MTDNNSPNKGNQKKEKIKYSLYIEKDLYEQIESLAISDDRKINNYILKVLKDHIRKVE